MSDIENTDDWLRGANDAREGNQHKTGQSKDYDRGYSKQYEFEQVKDAISEHNRPVKKAV